MQDIFQHQHTTDKIAREFLKKTAKISGIPYNKVCSLFINKNFDITAIFWGLLNKQYPEKYCGVEFCRTCKKFVLYERQFLLH